MAGVTALAIGAGIQAVGGLAQMASGIFGKKRRQRQIENMIAQRPEYKIPKEVKQDMEMRRNLVNAQLDEQQAMRDNLFTQQQNAIARTQASSGSLEDLLAVGASSDASMNNALVNLQTQGASQRSQRRNEFSQSLANLSQYRDQAFKINELDPYKDKMALTMENNKASREMIFGGINQAGAGVMNFGSAMNEGAFQKDPKASDARLKENIAHVGVSEQGHNIYTFEYIDKDVFGEGLYKGVMAQEMQPESVVIHEDGYLMVDYSTIDVDFEKIN